MLPLCLYLSIPKHWTSQTSSPRHPIATCWDTQTHPSCLAWPTVVSASLIDLRSAERRQWKTNEHVQCADLAATSPSIAPYLKWAKPHAALWKQPFSLRLEQMWCADSIRVQQSPCGTAASVEPSGGHGATLGVYGSWGSYFCPWVARRQRVTPLTLPLWQFLSWACQRCTTAAFNLQPVYE